jgi:hypothetical protein
MTKKDDMQNDELRDQSDLMNEQDVPADQMEDLQRTLADSDKDEQNE